ncbi:MAG: hypothetical protein GF418_16265 [Chitinivibrionales bacterium]|nr:hypothetical protein [Chitinivibrionales bacterium]
MLSPTAAPQYPGNEALNYLPMRTAPWSQGRLAGQGGSQGLPPAPANTASAQMVSEYFSSDTLSLTYTNNDGDTVSLSMQHVEYQKAMIQFEGDADSPEWKQMVEFIKDEYQRMHQEMLDSFIASVNGEKPEKAENREADTIEGLPEYWNAENTSQRIVDFAVSFYSLYEGTGEEYLGIIRGAIEEGFSQARDMLGELPDAVDKLVGDTYDLVMEKLDAWAAEQGIGTESVEETAKTVAA